MSEIALQTWLDALESVRTTQSHPMAITTRELAESLGVDTRTALRRVHLLLATGKARMVSKRITTLRGIIRTVPAYVLVDFNLDDDTSSDIRS